MLVFIHAYEDFYEGLHGVEDMRVVDVKTEREADEWGREMSYEVIESYGMDEHYFDADEEDEDDIDYADMNIGEHTCWTVFKIKDEFVGLGEQELEHLATRVHGASSFIDKYCEEAIWED
jgi:hypothetical protein